MRPYFIQVWGKNPFHESFPHIQPVSSSFVNPVSHPPCFFFFFWSSSVLSFAGIARQRSEGIQPVFFLSVLGGVILSEWGVGAGLARRGGGYRARQSERSQPGTTWTSGSCSMGGIPSAEVCVRVIVQLMACLCGVQEGVRVFVRLE